MAAFARTLTVHRRTLERLITDAEQAEHATVEAAQAFARVEEDQAGGELPLEEADAEAQHEADEEAAAEQASLLGARGGEAADLRAELAAVDEMLAIAENAKTRQDARARWLKSWIFDNLLERNSHWNNRRLIVFTEYEDTRRWLERRLTKTYNDFHDRRLKNDPEIQRLRDLHHAMDQAVLRAYGWDDLAAAAAPVFLDQTNEDEFAYQGRLFWPSEYRDEVLARLLALNAKRHADEVRRGVAPRQGGRAQATESDSADEEDAA
ncbi:MAG: hypothetical protein ACREJ0_19480 [Geminicoccaceae bacterium]